MEFFAEAVASIFLWFHLSGFHLPEDTLFDVSLSVWSFHCVTPPLSPIIKNLFPSTYTVAPVSVSLNLSPFLIVSFLSPTYLVGLFALFFRGRLVRSLHCLNGLHALFKLGGAFNFAVG